MIEHLVEKSLKLRIDVSKKLTLQETEPFFKDGFPYLSRFIDKERQIDMVIDTKAKIYSFECYIAIPKMESVYFFLIIILKKNSLDIQEKTSIIEKSLLLEEDFSNAKTKMENQLIESKNLIKTLE